MKQTVKPVRERKDKINMRVWSIAWLLGVITMGSVWWTYNHFFAKDQLEEQFIKGWCTAVTSRSEGDWIFEKISCFKKFPELEDKPTPRPTPANLDDDYWCLTMESIEDGSCRKDPSNKAPKDSNL